MLQQQILRAETVKTAAYARVSCSRVACARASCPLYFPGQIISPGEEVNLARHASRGANCFLHDNRKKRCHCAAASLYRKSNAARHTSHVTRHTSHITHHALETLLSSRQNPSGATSGCDVNLLARTSRATLGAARAPYHVLGAPQVLQPTLMVVVTP